ncbi:MAG: glycosyltransferase family 4 protein [Oligoflexia bacterium]|nr:glycosyltransferase family 4 protein [Oligoflexia bacterium]
MKRSFPAQLNICFTSHRYPLSEWAAPYGFLWVLTQRLADRGHKVTVITTESPRDRLSMKYNGVDVHYLERGLYSDTIGGRREAVYEKFEELHFQQPFDIVHSVDDSGLYIALHKKVLQAQVILDASVLELDQILGILGLTEETVLSYLSASFSIVYRFLKSFFSEAHTGLKRANGIFVASPDEQEILERFYFLPSIKSFVVPLGMDGSRFEPRQTKAQVLQQLGIEPDTQLILTVTPMLHVEETKNLLTAFERVVVKKPKTALVVIGEGPKFKEIELHALNLVLGSKVHFLGDVSPEQLNELINASDVFVNLYSRSSGYEQSVLEAMACCKTVITSNVGTSPHVIQNGTDGFLVRPTEIGSLSRLLIQVVSHQVDTRSIGDKARKKVLKLFDNERMVDETMNAYKKILITCGKYKA